VNALVDYLLKHFVFVIVIVGFLYAVLFRKSPIERPPNRMPDFGGGGAQRTGRPVPRPAQSSPQRAPIPAQPILRASPPPMPMAASQPQPERAPQSKEQERQTPYAAEAPAAFSVTGESRPLTREQLSRAIVWAEVLGPPRARRPYRR
jgi:hypothetical protein